VSRRRTIFQRLIPSSPFKFFAHKSLGVFPLAFAFLNEDDFKHFYDTIQLFEVSVNVLGLNFTKNAGHHSWSYSLKKCCPKITSTVTYPYIKDHGLNLNRRIQNQNFVIREKDKNYQNMSDLNVFRF
jgi:hypothetical protein